MGQMVAAFRDGVMSGIIETGNIGDPAAVFVGVFSAIFDNGVSTLIADITEPTGTGFARTAVTTWGTAYTMLDGRRVVDGPAIDFRPASSAEATTVLGWFWATLVTGGLLLEFGYFDDPIPLPDENAVVTVIPRLTVDPAGRWEATVSFNG